MFLDIGGERNRNEGGEWWKFVYKLYTWRRRAEVMFSLKIVRSEDRQIRWKFLFLEILVLERNRSIGTDSVSEWGKVRSTGGYARFRG